MPRAELSRYAVGVASNGRLQLRTDNPFNATGSVDYQIAVPDAQLWIRSLEAAGARTAEPPGSRGRPRIAQAASELDSFASAARHQCAKVA